MGIRVKKEKILMILFIRGLDDETLARLMLEQQQTMGWPGLAAETKEICAELGLEDCNVTKLSNKDFKENLDEACKREDEKLLRSQAEGKEKCQRIMRDNYGKKEYLLTKNIHQVRQQFRTRTGLQPFAGNYSHDKRFASTGHLCRCGVTREDESHLMSGNCPVYEDIHGRYEDFEDDEDLVSFFTEVLARRDELDHGEKEEGDE